MAAVLSDDEDSGVRAAAGPVSRGGFVALGLVVAAVAFLARLVPVARGGGLLGLHVYDDGVYYAAGVALVHGQLPYRDFVLLHPPGIALLTSPFALLTDATGLRVARAAFMVLGALNAVLVVALLRRFGLAAAAVGGLFYALNMPAVYVERSTLLEGPGNTLLLLALLLLSGRGVAEAGRIVVRRVLAGAALGASCAVKIWGVVPLAVVLLWELKAGGRRAFAQVLAGAAGVVTAVCLPFFVAAPGPMFRMVVSDQLGRPAGTYDLRDRLLGIGGITWVASGWSPATTDLALVAVLAVLGLAAVLALGDEQARLWVALLACLVTLVLLSPTYFLHYSGVVTPVTALALGTATAVVLRRVPRGVPWLPAAATATLLAVVVACGAAGMQRRFGTAFPAGSIGPVARAVNGCVTADDPTVLALLDVLSRDYRSGCRVWVDVTGLTYDVDRGRRPDGSYLPRRQNRPWQRDLLGYLTSGAATMVVRGDADRLSSSSAAVLSRLPVLSEAGKFRLLGVP